MRDIKRIDRIAELLNTLWKHCPDYRFWQLMQALEIPEEKFGTDPFFWEDDVWENIFLNNIKRYQNACDGRSGGEIMAYAVSVDFDGTLCENAYPEIGKPNLSMINMMIEKRRNGKKIILNTCREGKYLEDAVAWCKEQGLEFDAVNDNLPELIEKWGNNPRKIAAMEYWDDRNKLIP